MRPRNAIDSFDPRNHKQTCDFFTDFYSWECSCGFNEPSLSPLMAMRLAEREALEAKGS